MDFVHIAISARLAHGDLVAADGALEAGPSDDGVTLILVKSRPRPPYPCRSVETR
jgi:hypothetical protein